jgi:heme/copper-type cytochrome/quinol oxidase subunit 2
MMALMLIEYNVPNCFSIVKILIRQLKQTAIHMMAPIILGLFLLLFYFSSKLSRKQTKRE